MKRKQLEYTITSIIYILTATLSGLLSYTILNQWTDKIDYTIHHGGLFFDALLPLIIAQLIVIGLFTTPGSTTLTLQKPLRCFTRTLRASILLAAIWALILMFVKNNFSTSRYYFGLTMLFYIILLTLAFYWTQRYLMHHYYQTTGASLAAVLAPEARAESFVHELKEDWMIRVVGVSYLEEENSTDKFLEWVKGNAIDEVFILTEDRSATSISELVNELMQMGVEVHINLPTVEHLERVMNRAAENSYAPKRWKSLGYLHDIPTMTIRIPQAPMKWHALKRTFDIFGGLIGSMVALVLFIILGIIIKIDSPGPIIFAQERMGKNGRRFKMYKFRSMYRDAEARKAELMKQNEMEGLMFKMKDDPRITRVGKFIRKTSLDEFPQFWNVLKGDMSLVGTRPPTVGEFNQYSNYHKRRLAMKPGITGMWQVSGRSDITDFEKVVELDCQYIDTWSPKMDLSILARTVGAVLKHKGSS